jgi:hypothetical protein
MAARPTELVPAPQRRGDGRGEGLVPTAVPRDLAAHRQRPAEQRLHQPPRLVTPRCRRDGADQEQHADPGEEIRRSRHSIA